jgi:hypothetical protein
MYGQMTFSDNCMIYLETWHFYPNISKITKQSYFVICLNYHTTSFRSKNVSCTNYSTTQLKHKNVMIRCLKMTFSDNCMIYLETWHFYLFKWWYMINLDIKSVWIDIPAQDVCCHYIYYLYCTNYSTTQLKHKNVMIRCLK